MTVPYADTLQLYETVLTGTTAPASATKSIGALDTQLRTDIASFAAGRRGQLEPPWTVPRLVRRWRVLVLQADMTKLQQSLHPARTAPH